MFNVQNLMGIKWRLIDTGKKLFLLLAKMLKLFPFRAYALKVCKKCFNMTPTFF
jgi:hypothetical protein